MEAGGQVTLWGALTALGWATYGYFTYKNFKKNSCPLPGSIEQNGAIMNDITSPKRDIKNLKEFVTFGLAVIQAGKELFDLGRFHPEKLGEVFAVYQAAVPALQDISEVPAELEDLDESETEILVEMIVARGIMSQHASEVLAKALRVAANAYSLIKELKT